MKTICLMKFSTAICAILIVCFTFCCKHEGKKEVSIVNEVIETASTPFFKLSLAIEFTHFLKNSLNHLKDVQTR